MSVKQVKVRKGLADCLLRHDAIYLSISLGVVESSNRRIVTVRLKQSGMFGQPRVLKPLWLSGLPISVLLQNGTIFGKKALPLLKRAFFRSPFSLRHPIALPIDC